MIFDVVTNKLFKALLDGTAKVGKAKDSEKLGGKGASEYALIKCEVIDTSILEKALTLESGVYNFELGRGNYTGEDLPSKQYAYGMAGVYKPAGGGAVVVLWNQRYGLPLAINQHNGTSWLGWDTNATTADFANYLPIDGSKPITGNIFSFGNGFGKFVSSREHVHIGAWTNENNMDNGNGIVIYNENTGGWANKAFVVTTKNGVNSFFELLHSDNVGSYALPIGGGHIKGNVVVGDGTNNYPFDVIGNGVAIIAYKKNDGSQLGYLGINGTNKPVFISADRTVISDLHHDGNSAKVVFTQDSTTAPAADALWAHL